MLKMVCTTLKFYHSLPQDVSDSFPNEQIKMHCTCSTEQNVVQENLKKVKVHDHYQLAEHAGIHNVNSWYLSHSSDTIIRVYWKQQKSHFAKLQLKLNRAELRHILAFSTHPLHPPHPTRKSIITWNNLKYKLNKYVVSSFVEIVGHGRQPVCDKYHFWDRIRTRIYSCFKYWPNMNIEYICESKYKRIWIMNLYSVYEYSNINIEKLSMV